MSIESRGHRFSLKNRRCETVVAQNPRCNSIGFVVVSLALMFLPVSCQKPQVDEVLAQDVGARYEEKAQDLIASLRENHQPAALGVAASEVKELALKVARTYWQLYPSCRKYLQASYKATSDFAILGSEELDVVFKYRLPARLPQAPKGCDYARNLIVVPAMVAALSSQGKVTNDREQLVHRLEKTVEDLKIVKEFIRAKKNTQTL